MMPSNREGHNGESQSEIYGTPLFVYYCNLNPYFPVVCPNRSVSAITTARLGRCFTIVVVAVPAFSHCPVLLPLLLPSFRFFAHFCRSITQ